MMRAAIVDDNTEFLNVLHRLLCRCFEDRQILCSIDDYDKPYAFYYEMMESDTYDICFLDIEMPELDGIRLAEKIRENGSRVPIIFLSSHPEFIRAGYQVRAFDYLSKRDIREELPIVLDRLLVSMERNRTRVYVISTDSRIERIWHEDIIYIYKEGQYAQFVVRNGITQERKPLKDVMVKLGDDAFVMIERGFIVNLEHVARVSCRDVTMSNGFEIRASKEHIRKLKERMLAYWQQR